jgi:protein SCO1/2
MRLALTEASEGKLGTVGDKLLLFCFHYDPAAKSYVPFARNLMKLGGLLMILIVGAVLAVLWRRERAPVLQPFEDPNGVATAR